MKRQRIFLHNPNSLRCPDCGKQTCVTIYSLLGTRPTAAVEVSSELLRHLLLEAKSCWSASPYKDTTQHRITCQSCAARTQKVHWVLLGVDHVVGPWCIHCLKNLVWTEIEGDKGLNQDLLVFGVTATIDVLRRLHNVCENPDSGSGTGSEVVF